ncbi:LOW QUALITY PROTEIN: hypothetical protein PRUPE_1G459200 [Prunus persica]|uniref:non-specific serine/threonine protein kinase n=1 Tax=Prunus persica TaxID=3760 RepID=A0A251RFU0_PRUPE|nr:LOW QUALITY PROTEIN: hypothetical protein PRUPE_1G459200 [Prunus persica]
MKVLVVRLLIIVCTLFNAFVCCWSFMHSDRSESMESHRLGLLEGNERDRVSLLAVKAQIKEDPHHVLSSWNESIHFCMWHGVTCSKRHHQRVTVLNLGSQNLVGSISPHIGNLSFLRELLLQGNSFRQQIPAEIGRLHRLQVLSLHNNSLSGPIPTNISNCFNLNFIRFGRNSLVGKIPSQLGALSRLRMFVLEFINLTGEIPPSLGNLSSLERLAAISNNLLGSIPSSLGRLKNLTFLALDLNRLSGTIPPSIFNLSALTTFSVSINQIQGSLPSDLGITLPNLQNFHCFTNRFTGPIPLSISNATHLARFIVAENKLSGINQNYLGSGTYGDLSFISDLTNATKLGRLYLDLNNFGGTLPPSISNLTTELTRLWFQENQLHGNIPVGIGNLINLEILNLGNNHFTGSIPRDIGKLSSLGLLSLRHNKLSGSIPSSLGNLTMLTYLQLQENNLQGNIPSSLGQCLRLLRLNLSQNNLDGAIPRQVFGLPSLSISLDLSRNHMTGSLPVEIGKLKSLGVLDVSDNMLYGELPSNLGSCLGLEVLHLQGNFFNGTIPSSMASLRGIQDLDLSRNNFSGEIPRFLEGFDFLKNMNLSFNELWGAVPTEGVFKNASATSVIGNIGLCGSVASLRLPNCSSKESKGRRRLPPRLKLIISIVSAFLGIALVFVPLYLCLLRKKGKKTASSSANLANSIYNLIGSGSFGSVYKGVLDDPDRSPQLVAIKVFNLSRQGASKSFLAECEALRNIRHRNLAKIITACSNVDFRGNDFKALVYEFMENGSLEEWLHPTSPKNLSLVQRLDIVMDVACALDYLHNHCETQIVHCDLKPSNVLLDKELTGHVSDFGLAKFLSKLTSNVSENHQTSSIGVRGSVGYAAPEMFTGKRPTDDMFSGGFNLHNFAKMAFLDRRVTEVADSLLLQDGTSDSIVIPRKIKECLSSIFGIGIACSAESPADRKDIGAVAYELHSIRDKLLV